MHRATSVSAPARVASGKSNSFTVVEATIPEMRAALEQGRTTSREIVRQYLARIGMYEDKLHCIIAVNPHVLEMSGIDTKVWNGFAFGLLAGFVLSFLASAAAVLWMMSVIGRMD